MNPEHARKPHLRNWLAAIAILPTFGLALLLLIWAIEALKYQPEPTGATTFLARLVVLAMLLVPLLLGMGAGWA